MIDSHTHLNCNTLFNNWEKHISDFEYEWWNRLINAWADREYNYNWIEISKNYKWTSFIKCSIWLHPSEIVEWKIKIDDIDNHILKLEELYLNNKKDIVAIWEIWIDTHDDLDPQIEWQKILFDKQCKLAKKYNLPIVIHSRDDFDNTYDILKNYKDIKVYIHCRWYGPNEIKILQKEFPNLRIGFCWNTTYNSAQNLRDSLAIMNINQLLIETDAPYLPTKKFRWQINTPAMIIHLYDFISEFLWIEKSNLIKITDSNFDRLYK